MKPIIFIPGIEATNLVNTNTFGFELVWNAFDSLGTSLRTKVTGPYIEERLQLNPLFDEHIDSIVERQSIASFPYKKALHGIYRKLNDGKRTPDPLYLFGYDWRMSNVENGRRLQSFVSYLKEKLKDQKVEGFRFLTHSMGSHVFCSYLKLLSDFNDIDKVILAAPPFLGSPYALVHMVKGSGGFKSFLNKVFGRHDDMRKVVRTYPSIYELLPIYDNAISYTDSSAKMTLLKKQYWQSNVYDDIETLFDSRLKELNKYRWDNMMQLSDLPAEVRQRMLVVAGTKDKTLTYVKADTKSGKIKNMLRLDLIKDDQYNGSGDGTVPLISASCYKDSIKTLGVEKENFFDELSNNLDYHGLFLQDSRVQNIVNRYFGSKAMAALVSNNELASVRGNAASMWYSIGGTVHSISEGF